MEQISNIRYIYDGSFEGILTAIYEAYYRKHLPSSIIAQQDIQQDLFSQDIFIETDEVKANKVYQSVGSKISYSALQQIFNVYLSDYEEAATCIYRYLKLGWMVGKDVDRYLSMDDVLKVHNISRKVMAERHRLLGLVRFRCLQGNIYYASIEPDHNVAGLLAPHFAKRLADQKWIIHDLKRNLAAVYNKNEWVITEMNRDVNIILDEDEIIFQNLWKQYFDSIAIKEKINPRLQKRFMPMRYWKHLVEK